MKSRTCSFSGLAIGTLLTCPLVGRGGEPPGDTRPEWSIFRAHCRELARQLDRTQSPLDEAEKRRLQSLLEPRPADPDGASEAVQGILDAHCLAVVHINPESRVKATRGRAPAILEAGRKTAFLIKVENDAGVTHTLAVRGPQLASAREAGPERWLTAVLGAGRLNGEHVQYVVLLLGAVGDGKREATLQFDVGQGSQDLGFRSDLPILCSIRGARK